MMWDKEYDNKVDVKWLFFLKGELYEWFVMIVFKNMIDGKWWLVMIYFERFLDELVVECEITVFCYATLFCE